MIDFRDNLILTDIDGVVLFWQKSFDIWMMNKGHKVSTIGDYCIGKRYGMHSTDGYALIQEFNHSLNFRNISPMYDSVKYMRKMYEEIGMTYIGITAVDKDLEENRLFNLQDKFGSIFDGIYPTGTSERKRDVLSLYEGSGCLWIDDLPENCEMGLDYGLEPILYTQEYNLDYENKFIKRVSCWKDIYNIVLNK